MPRWRTPTSSSCGAATPGRPTRSSSTTCWRASATGAELFVVDPRRTASAAWADRWLGLDVGTDIALAHAVAREIIHAGLAEPPVRRAGHDRLRRVRGVGRGVDAGAGRGGDRRAGRRHPPLWPTPTAGPTGPSCAGRSASPSTTTASTTCVALINLALLSGHVGRYGSRAQPAAGPEQRPGRRRHGRHPQPAARASGHPRRRRPGQVRRRLGCADPAPVRQAPDRDVRGHGAGRADGRCTAWGRTRPSPRPTSPTPRRCSRASTTSSCRTSSSPRRPRWPTSCCRPPRRGARARAR